MTKDEIVAGATYIGPAEGIAKRYGPTVIRAVEYFFADGTAVSYRHRRYRRDGICGGATTTEHFVARATARAYDVHISHGEEVAGDEAPSENVW